MRYTGHGSEVQIINTHLGLSPRERVAQIEALLGSDWLAHPQCQAPVILCGDFNALPSSSVCRRLGDTLKDAQIERNATVPRQPFPAACRACVSTTSLSAPGFK